VWERGSDAGQEEAHFLPVLVSRLSALQTRALARLALELYASLLDTPALVALARCGEREREREEKRGG
jgi:hypothetical protein